MTDAGREPGTGRGADGGRPTEPATADVAWRAARAAEAVPGVAFLSPGLAGLLRTGARRPAGTTARGTAAGRPPGVRVRRDADGGRPARWHVEIQLAVYAGHRAADVAREVREAVRAALPAPGPAAIRISVNQLV